MAAVTVARWQILSALLNMLRTNATMTNVGVWPGWPGDQNVTPEMVWLEEITGTLDIPVFGGPRMRRDDQFTMPFLVQASGQLTIDDAMDRIVHITGAFETIVADDATLEDADSVVSAQITDLAHTVALTPEGPLAYARLVVSVHSRLN